MKPSGHNSDRHSDEGEASPDNARIQKALPDKLQKVKKPPPVAQSMNEESKFTGLPPISELKAKIEQSSSSVVQFKDKPIQLVRINHDIGKFQVCEEGVKILQNLEGNIGIVAFTGLYRTGKSFMLNLLLDKQGKGVFFIIFEYLNL